MHTWRCVGTNRERSCTYHWVHKLRSMPVRALQQRMAVFIRTEASFSGSAPSKEGDQWPPMAMASSLPRIPTRNWKQRSSNGLRKTGKMRSALKVALVADTGRDNIRYAYSTQQSIQQWNRTDITVSSPTPFETANIKHRNGQTPFSVQGNKKFNRLQVKIPFNIWHLANISDRANMSWEVSKWWYTH